MLRCWFNICTLPFSLVMLCIVSSAANHPYNMMLPHLCFMVGMVFFSLQACPFPSKYNNSLCGQTVIFIYFFFIRLQEIFLKSKLFVLMCSHILQSVIFLVFLERGLLLAERPFRLSHGSLFTMNIDACVAFAPPPVRGPLLLFQDWFAETERDRTHLLPEQYDSCLVQWFVQMNKVNWGIRKLFPRMTCSG